MGRRLVKPTPERGRFRELGWTRKVGISHIVGDGGGMSSRRDVAEGLFAICSHGNCLVTDIEVASNSVGLNIGP